MIRHTMSALVLAAATLAPLPSHASFFKHDTAAETKGKMVKVVLKNRTSNPMELVIDDKPLTLAADSEYQLKAVEGTHVYGADKSVKVVLTRELDGTTCSFR